MVTLAATLRSFAQAAQALAVAADLDISSRHLGRLAREVGAEMARARDDNTLQHRRRQLPAEVANAPTLAAIEVDGGRLFTRQAGCGPGVHQAQAKEDKIGCLLSLESRTHQEDPQPEPPPAFRDCRRVVRLVQRVHGGPPGLMPDKDQPAPQQAKQAEERAEGFAVEPWRGAPKRRLRTCVATLHNSQAFGPMLAAEAQRRNFYRAGQQVYLGDGAPYNWHIQRGYFPHAVPITDFLHVVCYVYLAAWAVTAWSARQAEAAPGEAAEVGEAAAVWERYERWMRSCWQGGVVGVIEEMAWWQEKLGRPPPGDKRDENEPVGLLAAAVTYLTNNQGRMDYPRYRQQGLPVTSSLVESLVGEFNARVKEKNKHWDRPEGGEAILQLRAAVLSEDDRLARFFAKRPGCLYRRRPSIN
jgi:hypothetical protein